MQTSQKERLTVAMPLVVVVMVGHAPGASRSRSRASRRAGGAPQRRAARTSTLTALRYVPSGCC